ncbi:MAG: hypothetical protein J6T10_30535 [Methanobrevibacter sp.]|nr:hypothetical protein [Methanobrevibacter sp.]
MECKFLEGTGVTWYNCKFTKRRCGYQKYCTEKKQYLLNCDKCPICKNKKSTQTKTSQ